MLVAIVLEISWNKVSFECREVIIPDLCIHKCRRVACVGLEFVEVLCVGSGVILEVYHTMPDLCLCVGIGIIGKEFSLCIVDILLFFKIHIGIDTGKDEVLMINYWQWYVSNKHSSDKLTRSVLFSIKIDVFKELHNIFGLKCLGIDRENSCFGIGYTSLDITTGISLDIT